MTTFRSVGEAVKAGWSVYDRLPDGYLIKIRTARGWEIGRVIIPTEAKREST